MGFYLPRCGKLAHLVENSLRGGGINARILHTFFRLYEQHHSTGQVQSLRFWQKLALGPPSNRFTLVWEKSSNGKWLKTAFENRPRTGKSRGNARDEICAFKLALSRHIIWFAYIFAFDSGSLLIAGGWRKCGMLLIFLSNCSICVPLAASGMRRSTCKRICRGTLSQKTRNWPGWLMQPMRDQPAHVFALESWLARSVRVRGPACLRLCWALTF